MPMPKTVVTLPQDPHPDGGTVPDRLAVRPSLEALEDRLPSPPAPRSAGAWIDAGTALNGRPALPLFKLAAPDVEALLPSVPSFLTRLLAVLGGGRAEEEGEKERGQCLSHGHCRFGCCCEKRRGWDDTTMHSTCGPFCQG